MHLFNHIAPRDNNRKGFGWLYYNNFKTNSSNYDSFLSPFNLNCIDIKNSSMEEIPSEKLLEVTVESRFTFEQQVNESCRKGKQTLHATYAMC